MGLWERISRLTRANFQSLLGNSQDPEKILEQAVMEMQQELIKLRQGVALAIATQKRHQRQLLQHQSVAQQWYQRAQLALGKGDETLAREALFRRQSYQKNAQALQSQMEQQQTIVNKLKEDLRNLEQRLLEAKNKKDMYIARARSAIANQRIQELTGNLNSSQTLNAFERIEEKLLTLEAEADLLTALPQDDLEAKFKLLEQQED